MKIKVVRRKLGREKAIGLAHKAEGLIEIDPRLSPKRTLETLSHETLHCIFPDMTEAEVDRAGMILCNVLWKEGYRVQ